MAENITKWTDDEIISLIDGDMQKAESIQTELAEQRSDGYKRFRMEPYGNERDGFSQSVAPTVYSNHKWTMANLMEIFNEDFFILKGEDENRSANFQKLIYCQMFRNQDGFRRFYDFLWTAILNHYAVFKVFRKDDFDLENETYDALSPEQMMQLTQDPSLTVSKYTEVDNDDGSISYENVKVVRKRVIYSGPALEVVPLWEFRYSPDCRITDWGGIDGRLVYHKYKSTLNDVRKKEKAGVYKKGTYEKIKAKYDPVTPDPQDKIEVLFNADSVSMQDTQEPSDQPENILSREVEISECYYRLDIDGDGLLEPVIIDICGDVVCRIIENPYKKPCFRVGHIAPEPHKVTGLTMPSLLDNDQKIATNLLRLIQDSAAIDCYKNPVTSDHQMFTMLQNRKPFAVIKGDPNKLGEVKTSPPSQFILKAYELLKAENEEKTGITRYNQGMDASSLNKTATGIDAIMSASAKPLRLIARILGNGAIMGVIRDFIFINQKWPPESAMKLLGTNIVVNPEDMMGEHDIEIDIGVGPAEKTAMANQLDLLIQFGTQAGVQLGIMTPLHMIRAEKKKYKLLGVKVDDLLLTEQEFQQEQQRKAQEPPKEDWKEFVQMDKLYPLLTRNEQAQILQRMGIQPDPNAQVAGIPQAKDVMDAQAKQQDTQLRAVEAQNRHKVDVGNLIVKSMAGKQKGKE